MKGAQITSTRSPVTGDRGGSHAQRIPWGHQRHRVSQGSGAAPSWRDYSEITHSILSRQLTVKPPLAKKAPSNLLPEEENTSSPPPSYHLLHQHHHLHHCSPPLLIYFIKVIKLSLKRLLLWCWEAPWGIKRDSETGSLWSTDLNYFCRVQSEQLIVVTKKKSPEGWYCIPKSSMPLSLAPLEGILCPVGYTKRELHFSK